MKAPFVLIHYPGILAAVVAGALLLSLTSAAYPLFLDSNSSRLLEDQTGSALVGRYGMGISYASRNIPVDRRFRGQPLPPGARRLYDRRGRTFADLVEASGYLASVEETMVGPEVSVQDPENPGRVRSGRVAAGEDVLDHVDVIDGHKGQGVWVPDLIARGLGLQVGDNITLGGGRESALTLPVDGIYRALVSQPTTGYWRPWNSMIYPISGQVCEPNCPIPPQFILMERDRLLQLSSGSAPGRGLVSAAWQAPLREDVRLTMDDASSIESFFHTVYATATQEGSRVHRILGCCPPSRYYRHDPEVTLTSEIDHVVEAVQARVVSLEGPGRVLQVAALLVAMTVLASAGLFSVKGRSTEFRLRWARGSGPLEALGRGAAEVFAPSILGGALGLGLAIVLALAVTSGPPLAPSALRTAMLATTVAIAASVAGLAIVAAVAAVPHSGDRAGLRRLATRIPWEIPVLGFALFAAVQLPSSLGSTEVSAEVQSPSPYLLLFPIAFVGGLSGVGARLFRRGAEILRRRSRGWGPSSYLAVHRLAGAPLLSVVLVAAAGLSLGILFQGRALVQSLRTTVHAKASVFVGSDVRAWVYPDTKIPEDFPFPATIASRARLAGTGEPGGRTFDLLGVDPSTLARAAYWHEGFSDVSLRTLAGRLRGTEGAVPVIVAGASDFSPSTLTMNERVVRVRVVAHTRAFPGMLSRRPLVVLSAERLEQLYAGTLNPLRTRTATTEVWVRGPVDQAKEALLDPAFSVFLVNTSREVQQLPRVATILDTFSVLNLLGAFTGILVAVALVMYLQARQRSQIVAFGLSSRMGMSRRSYRRSLLMEVSSMLLVALLLGIILGVAAAILLVSRLDPLPVVPPDPLFILPVAPMAVVLVAALGTACGAAWLTVRRAASVELGKAMRVAE
jgi:putative ABC transport system permease protein